MNEIVMAVFTGLAAFGCIGTVALLCWVFLAIVRGK